MRVTLVISNSPATLVLISQLFSVLLLVYFLLAIGRLYRRKVVKISGPSFKRMRKAARILNDLHFQVRRYLFVMLISALFVGILPWLTSFVSSLNAVVIFVGLLFWGWLWGPVGLIVATPILMITKSLCDHVVNLRPVGELLGK